MFLLIYSIRKKDVVPKETKNNVTDFEMNISSPPSSKSEVAYQKIPHPQPLTHYITFHCFLIWICSCCFQNKVINKIYAVLIPMQSVLKNDITHMITHSLFVLTKNVFLSRNVCITQNMDNMCRVNNTLCTVYSYTIILVVVQCTTVEDGAR